MIGASAAMKVGVITAGQWRDKQRRPVTVRPIDDQVEVVIDSCHHRPRELVGLAGIRRMRRGGHTASANQAYRRDGDGAESIGL